MDTSSFSLVQMRRKKVRRVVDLNYFLRNHALIKAWRESCLLKYSNKCAILHMYRKGQIHIHHITPHAQIRDEVLAELGLLLHENIGNYSSAELKSIVEKYAEKHMCVEGIPLLKRVHKLFHKHYGMKATAEDFEDFKSRWVDGKFKQKKSTE